MTPQTELGARMWERADTDGLPADHELRQRAQQFETAAAGFFADEQTVSVRQFAGAWARARRAWCEHTGETLV
ncbi:hypothetical protein [Salinicola sp. DM10]|uniref:hypothetical protein n=1 Tax=Salinicola sp. DM10 TaxID=2815721 RepID=UPI001A8DD2A8|nr:hypothetical protein [Salinicola sp. DM10]MCE3025751.1 hypothetical protein [Salinicola sp. DM10]